ncbi:MAG: PQQ-binding-like beta-propeller repeat protein [Solirubrobacteraceae bacterium]
MRSIARHGMRLAGAAALCGLALAGAGGSTAAAAAPARFSYGVPLDPKSPWPKFRRTAGQTGRSPVLPGRTGGHRWDFPTSLGIFSSPVIGADGTVYIGSADTRFYAIRPDGRLRWSARTGEIIDSAALLDDRGRVYVGSGDGHLYAFDARTGRRIWRFAADAPAKTGAFINWFEGNVAIEPDGTLLAPNDNFRTYALDRSTRAVRWAFATPDQTWSLPAVDVARRRAVLGSNFFFGGAKDTFALDSATGTPQWQAHADGAVVASPLLRSDGTAVVGAFDGFARAYDVGGRERWAFPTRDHIYASAAEQPDGTIVQASADGSVYGIDPATGRARWQFDTLNPIRSSPAVDGRGNVYVGSGDGRLIVLNRNGTLRWALRLARPPRGTLNSSPALGRDAVVIADSNGDVHSVPYDWCLRAAGRRAGGCELGPRNPLPAGARVFFTTPFGITSTAPPRTIDANQPLAFSLAVRTAGRTRLAVVDAGRLRVTADPPAALRVVAGGDRRSVIVLPRTRFATRGGRVRLRVAGDYLVGLHRTGLAFSGGRRGGTFDSRFTFQVRSGSAPASFPLPVPAAPGASGGAWEYRRVALSLPDILPSYNQIGFDRLRFLIGTVERRPGGAIVWMTGGKAGPGGRTVADPAARWMVPFVARFDRGLLTLENAGGATFELNGFENEAEFWRITARTGRGGAAIGTSGTALAVDCAKIGFYGQALQDLGMCAPGRPMQIYGGAELRVPGAGTVRAPAGVGTVRFVRDGGRVVATLSGSRLRPATDALSVLLVDAASGRPLPADYSYGTQRTANPDGTAATVSVPLPAGPLPASVRAYLMAGAYPAARATVALGG